VGALLVFCALACVLVGPRFARQVPA